MTNKTKFNNTSIFLGLLCQVSFATGSNPTTNETPTTSSPATSTTTTPSAPVAATKDTSPYLYWNNVLLNIFAPRSNRTMKYNDVEQSEIVDICESHGVSKGMELTEENRDNIFHTVYSWEKLIEEIDKAIDNSPQETLIAFDVDGVLVKKDISKTPRPQDRYESPLAKEALNKWRKSGCKIIMVTGGDSGSCRARATQLKELGFASDNEYQGDRLRYIDCQDGKHAMMDIEHDIIYVSRSYTMQNGKKVFFDETRQKPEKRLPVEGVTITSKGRAVINAIKDGLLALPKKIIFIDDQLMYIADIATPESEWTVVPDLNCQAYPILYNPSHVSDILRNAKIRKEIVEAKRAIAKAKSATTETQPATTETSVTTDTPPATTDTPPATTETQPAATDTSPATTDTQPATTETSVTTETQPATEIQLATANTKPETTETQPAIAETQPALTENQVVAETQPATTDTQVIAETQPAITDTQPVADTQPAAP
ncbi:MAG: hypothetical protein LBQ43_02870 [Holosporales bacterium]|jgi:hypothetical protein|nr:hypothetical protein [Holosporales bacterium]